MICRKRARSSSLKRFGHARHSLPFVGRNLQDGESLPATLATSTLRRKRTICRAKCWALWPSTSSLSTMRSTSSTGLFARHRIHHVFQHVGRDCAHQPAHHVGAERGAAAGNRLVHDAERVAHRAVADFGQHRQRGIVSRRCLPARRCRATAGRSRQSAPHES